MPRRHAGLDDYASAIPQIILSSTDSDFLDQLIPILKDAATSKRTPILIQCLTRYSYDREADIERIGLTKHEEFLDSVSKLQLVRESTVSLTSEILELNQSIQASTEKLAEQKGALVNTKAVRQNIADTTEALKESLKVLHAVNSAHDLVRQKNYYSSLKSLEDLQNEHLVPIIQNRYATQHRLAGLIQQSIPASRKAISEAVMTDLSTWLFRVRETSQFLGEVAFYHTEMRRTRQRQRVEEDQFMGNFRLNSSIELVCDENQDFDVLNNEELQVNFTPLFEATHIHEALDQIDRFRSEYATTRKQQKDLLLPNSVELLADDESSLSSLLEGIAGFAIIERETLRRLPHLRSDADIVSTDDYMPMAINSREEYEKVINVSWFIQAQSIDEVANFLNQFYFFSDDHFQHTEVIDETLRKSLDELLTEKVCRSLVERLSSQYLGQIVQILINLEHFEIACQELEQLLIRARSSSAGGPLKLNATEEFRNSKKIAEKRIFELVNSKIDDLIDTAEYDW
ncbi:hypothetical protein UVI_02025820 [Ustilaginoidea virens]|uniref:Exocyst complex component SEC15 n=1 Tax=Ustilaginoidea virens TaxID=1159556 RepID=A0A1B5KR80_USTVR|nr:hypothetical protein UVI_02025820 [Ustilaginoidea virens]